MKVEETYEYIQDYKNYSVYQDMDDGYFVIIDVNDNILYREATIDLLLKSVPDNK